MVAIETLPKRFIHRLSQIQFEFFEDVTKVIDEGRGINLFQLTLVRLLTRLVEKVKLKEI